MAQVDCGTLSMEGYLQQLREAIVKEKARLLASLLSLFIVFDPTVKRSSAMVLVCPAPRASAEAVS